MFSLFAVEPSFPLACFSFRRCPFFYKKERATKKLEAVNKHFCETRVDNITQSAFFVLQKLFVPSSTDPYAVFLFWKRKTALKEKQARGRENPSFPRTNRSRAPTTSSETVFSPLPNPPRSRYVPGGSYSPIPRYVRILNLFVVNICLPRHRNFVIGERVKENSGGRKKPSP